MTGDRVSPEQENLLRLYKEVRRVFVKRGIRFYALFGTALGAVRHSGMIPWDDDIDIGVFAEDLPRVEEAMRDELDTESYYYHIPSADTHSHVVMKTDHAEEDMRNKKAPFLDIFVIEPHPAGKIRSKISWFLIWAHTRAMAVVYRVNSESGQKMLRWIPKAIHRLNAFFVEGKTDMTAIWEDDFRKSFHPCSVYGTPVMHKFEDTEIPLPEKWDEVLTEEYGDYMTPPPEDKRCGAGYCVRQF